MNEKIFYGEIEPEDLANALLAEFNRPPWQAQRYGKGRKIAVQIANRPDIERGGATALTIHLQKVANGILVRMGQQTWANLAASMGITVLAALRNPWSLLSRLDDLAQDFESIQLRDRAWEVITSTCQMAGTSHILQQTLDRQVCEYCQTPNALDAPHCVACGAPLKMQTAITCPYCGFPVPENEAICSNCHRLART